MNLDGRAQLIETLGLEEILNGLRKSKHLEKYYNEFVTLLDLLHDAHKTQNQLLNKWREVKTECHLKEKELKETREQRLADSYMINQLKEELEKSYRSIENAQKNDFVAKDEIQQLKLEILHLQDVIHSMKQKRDVEEFDIDAARLINSLRVKISDFEREVHAKDRKLEDVEEELSEALALVHQHEDELKDLKSTLEKELDRNVKADRSRIIAQKLIKEQERKIRSLEEKNAELKKYCSSLESQLESQKLRAENLQRRNKELHNLYKKTQKDLALEVQKMNALTRGKTAIALKLEKKHEEVEMLSEKLLQAEKARDLSVHKIATLRYQSKTAEMRVEMLKSELENARKDLSLSSIKHSEDERTISILQKEKENLKSSIAKLEHLVDKHKEQCRQLEKVKSSVTHELQSTSHEVEHHKRTISSLEAIQQKLQKDVSEQKQKVVALKLQCNASRSATETVNRNAETLADDLKAQQKMYESACHDLSDSFESYKELKEYLEKQLARFSTFSQQIDALEYSIDAKNKEMRDLCNAYGNQEKQIKMLSDFLENQKVQAESLKIMLREKDKELRDLTTFVAEKDKDYKVLEMKCSSVTKDRNILASQVLRKSESLSRAKSEIKKLDSSLLQKDYHLQMLESELQLTRQEVTNLLREKSALAGRLSHFEKTKEALNQVQEELVQEKLKSKVGDAETHPWNIHRWRILEGTDPERYDLLMKHRFLQKRLISKTVEAQEKAMQLSEKDKMLEELKSLASKRAASESSLHVADYKWQLREKNDKIKVLSAQVNMYETLVSGYKAEIEELKEKLSVSKRKLFYTRVKAIENSKDIDFTLSD